MAYIGGAARSDKGQARAPESGTDAARVRYLTVTECKRLLNACDPVFGH